MSGVCQVFKLIIYTRRPRGPGMVDLEPGLRHSAQPPVRWCLLLRPPAPPQVRQRRPHLVEGRPGELDRAHSQRAPGLHHVDGVPGEREDPPGQRRPAVEGREPHAAAGRACVAPRARRLRAVRPSHAHPLPHRPWEGPPRLRVRRGLRRSARIELLEYSRRRHRRRGQPPDHRGGYADGVPGGRRGAT